MDEERKVKKKVFPGLIEADKLECAIVVHYEILEPGALERQKKSTKLRLKTLDERSDTKKLAEDIMRKCKYIPSSKRFVVETLVANLQEYCCGNPDARRMAEEAQKAARRRRQRLEDSGSDSEGELQLDEKIPTYIDLLYEDEMREKVKGTGKILKLCRHVGNLEHLVQREHLMGSLSRVLGEEYKRSSELTYNIVRIFLSFSNFLEMHRILAKYKAGAICCEVVEFEVRRSEHRVKEQRQRAAALSEAKVGLTDSREGIVQHERRVQQLERDQQREEDLSQQLQRKQDKTLYVCLYVLINLAEDVGVEHKMTKKNLVDCLVAVFAHSNSEPLLCIAALFLRKFALFEVNKDAMLRTGLVAHLARFLPCSSEQLVVAVLRLLFNLSFDSMMREQMVKSSMIPRLVSLLSLNHKFREQSLRLLYHLSVDDRCKNIFAYTNAIPLTMQLILRFPADRKITRELAALAVNLSLNKNNAQVMCANKGLQGLVQRVERTHDPLLMKVVRNISLWTLELQQDLEEDAEYQFRGLWSRHVTQILTLATETDSHDLLVEALGCLGNLTKNDLLRGATWSKYVEEFNLNGFLSKLLVPGMAQHDVVLEAVIFTGVLARDRDAAQLVASSSLARSLEEVWRDKSDDAEIVLQLLFTFRNLFSHRETHDEIVYNSRVLLDILDCLNNPNPQVVAYAEACLDLVMEHNRDEASGTLGELGAQVRRRRFYDHNREWFEVQTDNDEGPRRGRANFPSPAASSEDNSEVDRLSPNGRDNGREPWQADVRGEW